MATLGSEGFWPKTFWPPNSPNLNPLDYHVWTRVETNACATSHSNVPMLKASVNRHWAKMSAADLVCACKGFRRRLEACIAAEGGVFEK